MSAKLAVVGAVTAGLFAVGGVASAIAFQPAPAREVQMVQPAADTSTPTETATVAPVVVPTAAAPAPVESAPAPTPVVAPKPEVIVPKAVEPAPVVAATPGVPRVYPTRKGTPGDVNGNPIPEPVLTSN